MDIALYYIVLIGAVMGSVHYLRSGVKLLLREKTSEENHRRLSTIAIWKTAFRAFNTVLWITVTIVSIYNQVSSVSK